MIEQQHGNVCYLQFNHYRQFPGLIHGVFTRTGGYSQAPYQGLNTFIPEEGEGDSIDNVVRNRMLVLQALGQAEAPAVSLIAEHCADVIIFDPRDEWYTDWASYEYEEHMRSPSANLKYKGDALITQQHGTALVLSFADCAPILLYDSAREVIGIAHGGWRGSARGMAVATVEAMAEHFGSEPQHIYAGIGPAIGACCYEVSETVRQIFQGELSFEDKPTSERYQNIVRESAVFSTQVLPDKTSLRLDLQEINRNQLLMAKVPPEQIEVMRICTGCNTDRFFSHRRENSNTGRFPVIIALAADQ